MTTATRPRIRPDTRDDVRTSPRQLKTGVLLAIVGLTATFIAFFANLSAAGDVASRAAVLPWSFGPTTLGFGTIKLGIGVILWGIVLRIWLRAESLRDLLQRVVTPRSEKHRPGTEQAGRNTVEISHAVPTELAIHRMAKRMWTAMLVMGAMAVVIGAVISLAWSSNGSLTAAAWTQGPQFLGEGLRCQASPFSSAPSCGRSAPPAVKSNMAWVSP